MVTLGSDSHKRTHTVVVIDDNGRQLAQKTLLATSAWHLDALQWASRWPQRRWALEDCRQVSRRLEADLLVAGEVVVRVPPKLTVVARKVARTTGKSDPIDALAVARAALREPDLPVAWLDVPAATCACCSTTAMILSVNELEFKIASAGTSTNSSPKWRFLHAC